MTIYFYNKGDHGTGFTGFRVVVTVAGQVRQHYYPVHNLDPESLEYKRQRREAYLKAIELLQEAIESDYLVMTTQSNPRTLTGRGLGVHGITMAFRRMSELRWAPAFITHRFGESPEKVYLINRHGYLQAWRQAVNHWADAREISDEDRQRMLDSPPDPQRFKTLRRIENEQRGADIPVEALEPVFRHQREHIKSLRQSRYVLAQAGISTASELAPAGATSDSEHAPENAAQSEGDTAGGEGNLEAEIADWFYEAAKDYAPGVSGKN